MCQCAHGDIVIESNGEILNAKGEDMPRLFAMSDAASPNDNG
jgi:hypothetical protein